MRRLVVVKGGGENELRKRMVGNLLRRARVRAGMTQQAAASALECASAQYVSNWERGLSLPPLESLPRVCDVYGIEPKAMIEALTHYQEAHWDRRRRALKKMFR